jgi:two-component system sensor histidine kinase BarA
MLEREEHVRIINSAATDLLTVVNDILDFSKMEAGKLTLNIKPFCPRELLEDIAALMSKTAHLKQLEFIFEVENLPQQLLGDAFKVKQVISNLLSNALKFTNYGHIKLSAKVSAQNQDQCTIDFEVKDTGIGINQNDINKLFVAFQQLDDDLNRSFQGTGLGLIICQQLTSLMDGQIHVKSEPAKGSVFTATISFMIDNHDTTVPKTSHFNGQTAYIIDSWDESHRAAILQLKAVGFAPISVENVAQLAQFDVGDDYVFVSFPFREIDTRNRINEALISANIANVVILYSGPEPSKLASHPALPAPKFIRMPLTTRKLEDIDASLQTANEGGANEYIKHLPAIRMLAVDDIELNLRLLQTWLKPSAITLDLAYDGQSAIDLCQHTEYDLILMDIQMPNMDGLQTTQFIRKTQLNLGTPIVAVTAHAMEAEQQHFLDSGMDDFLSKPINLANLVSLINEWCEQTPVEASSKLHTSANAIDWDASLSLCYNDQAAAIEFLDDFTKRLSGHAKEIENGWNAQASQEVLASIHKLHGACCYTGVPYLKAYCDQAQTLLKQQQTQGLTHIIASLLTEIDRVIEAWPKLRKSLQ